MLRAEGIRKEFNDKVALSDINLTFPEKGLVIIKGESGSGKTTLLNLLTANDFPSGGKIVFNGIEITSKNAEEYRTQYCGNIYQDYMLIEDLSVKENIEIAMQVIGQEYSEEDIKALLKKVDLPEEYLDKKVIKLSGGEKQRVAIARAISKQNAMIFADEPTGNLDSKNGKIIMDLLKEISKERLVVVVSHNEKYNIEYADYTIKLVDGETEYEDLPKEEKEEEQAENIFDKKSKYLKPKTMARLAYWGFEKNRVKTAVSVIAFVILCIFSTLLLSMSLQDFNLSLSRSFDKASDKNILLTIPEDTDSQKVEEFCQKLSKESPVYNLSIRNEIDGEQLDLQYAVVYDKEAGADIKILHGRLPEKANEIAIPEYAALFLINYDEDYSSYSVEDLIGKEYKYLYEFATPEKYYSLKIVGIFDEREYLQDYKDLNSEEKAYLKWKNFLAQTVFFGEGAQEIFNLNPEIFDEVAPSETYKCTYDGKEIKRYGYDKFAEYSKTHLPLDKGEIYVDKSFAEENNLKQGDTITIEYGIIKKYKYFYDEIFIGEGKIENLKIKGITDIENHFTNSIIFSQEDFEKCLLKNGQNNYNVKALFVNAKDVKYSYSYFNTLSKDGKDIWTKSQNNLESYVKIQNVGYINNFFYIIRRFRSIIIPFTIFAVLGMLAMGTVAASYLIASKEKSYIVMRSVGCGKKNITRLLILQLVTLSIIEIVLGLIAAGLSAEMVTKFFLRFVLGVRLSMASEVLMSISWLPVIIVFFVNAFNVMINILSKTKRMFSKSIMENKTK